MLGSGIQFNRQVEDFLPLGHEKGSQVIVTSRGKGLFDWGGVLPERKVKNHGIFFRNFTQTKALEFHLLWRIVEEEGSVSLVLFDFHRKMERMKVVGLFKGLDHLQAVKLLSILIIHWGGHLEAPLRLSDLLADYFMYLRLEQGLGGDLHLERGFEVV